MSEPVMQTLLSLPGRRQGKVRDVYDAELNDGTPVLLIVASDRISAYDVVMPTPIPDKGVILTQMSRFWFDMIGNQMTGQVRHHLISTDPTRVQGLSDADKRILRGRVMVGHKAKVVPIECVARGYLAGSAWKEYQNGGEVCGTRLPKGLRECARLPEPIFTPATKAEEGHDENVSYARACELVGGNLMHRLRELTLAIYELGHKHAAARGIILADTKFEFGLLPDGSIMLIDEVLTPDSSRFWPADEYEVGRDQRSFDKQYLRNYLTELVAAGKWDKTPPGPALADEIVANTRQRYLDAYRQITGASLQLT